ncbi:hypothetical protein V1477_002876 [Vespula maculifrons]|uniref:Uncharacterized protein n=1 Tax=Vespula maculifrons TaxID=7453 RepID=A0ABD2CV16_VESMC
MRMCARARQPEDPVADPHGVYTVGLGQDFVRLRVPHSEFSSTPGLVQRHQLPAGYHETFCENSPSPHDSSKTKGQKSNKINSTILKDEELGSPLIFHKVFPHPAISMSLASRPGRRVNSQGRKQALGSSRKVDTIHSEPDAPRSRSTAVNLPNSLVESPEVSRMLFDLTNAREFNEAI